MHDPCKQRHVSLCIVFYALLTLSPAAAISAESGGSVPPRKVTIAYSSISGNMAPVWVTFEAGLFHKYGIDAQIVFIEGGPTAAKAILSGDVDVAEIAGAAVLQSNLQGSGMVMIAGLLNTMNYQLIVAKSITRPDLLKGKALAVSRYGSSSDFATRYALDKYGLQPGKDVAILEIGTQPARFAALETGKIQGVMLEVPLTLQAKKMGFSVLADLQMLGLEYQHTGLATTQTFIKSRPDLVRDIMKALAEGIHYYKTHRRESLAILAKYLKTAEPEGLAETYDILGLRLLPEKPYPTLRGIQIMLRELAAKQPKARAARPEQFVDLTFITELDKSGFIDRLYKTQPAITSREQPLPATASVTVKEKTQTANEAKPAVAQQKPVATPAPADGAQKHTVKVGVTLTRLALQYYGDALKWWKIYEANKQTVKNPQYIYVGQTIIIPAP